MELVTNEKPDLSNMRIFGCPTYVHIDASLRKKLGNKAWKGIFVGYSFDSPAWLVYNPATRHVIRSRNVVFDETWRDTIPSPPGPPIPEDDVYDDDYEIIPLPIQQEPTVEISDVSKEDPDEPEAPTRYMQLELDRIARVVAAPRTRSERAQVAKASALNIEDEPVSEVVLLAVSEPSSYNQAMKIPEKPLWRKAVEAE